MQSKNKDGNIQTRGTDLGTIYRDTQKKCGVNTKMKTKYKKLPRFATWAMPIVIKRHIENNAHMSPGADSNSMFESSTPGKILKGGKNGSQRNC